MGPQETLVKYPTTGIWGPQRGKPPPPLLQPRPLLASCLRHACHMLCKPRCASPNGGTTGGATTGKVG